MIETTRPQEGYFSGFGNLEKHDAQVLEITSPTKEIIISITFFNSNVFCKPHGWSEACESCECAFVAVLEWRVSRLRPPKS